MTEKQPDNPAFFPLEWLYHRDFESLSLPDLLSKITSEAKRKDKTKTMRLLAAGGGFKSAGHFNDLLKGRIKIKLNHFEMFMQSFGFEGTIRSHFHLLFKKEAIVNRRSKTDMDEEQWINSQIASSKKLLKLYFGPSRKRRHWFKSLEWPIVFAALNENNPVTLPLIVEKTNLSLEKVKSIIAELLNYEIAKREDGGYIIYQDLYLKKMSSHSDDFKVFYEHQLNKTQSLMGEMFDDPNCLFSTSVFSLDPGQVTKIRSRLIEVINDFVIENKIDDSEQNRGEIFNLQLGFFPQNPNFSNK